MKLPHGRSRRLFVSGLCVLWLGLIDRQAAQSPMSVTPANPTIVAGQTQQFTANGAMTASAVSAGADYTCVRLPSGAAQCTGRNQFGQLGDGSWTDFPVLVPVSGITTATGIAAGHEFACAVLANGTAKCWGLGESGQRGDGTFGTFALTPVSVNNLTGAVDLAAGFAHACARLSNGSMRCWGENIEGQLGNGTTANPGTAQPVNVSGISGATAFTTGAYHTCAVLGNGTLRCWGRNGNAQLGNGTYTNSSSPVTVTGITTATAVSGGGAHTCTLLSDGTVRCWGENDFGQLGNGTTAGSTIPVPVTGLSGVVGISAGWRHTCAVLGSGAIQCWGQNLFGQLGDGTITNRTTPVPVSGITGGVGVTAGWWRHSCALIGGGTVRCWGANQWGQFGNNTTTSSTTPVTMTGPGVTWVSSNTGVATINGSGLATGVNPGTTTITATDSGGATANTTLTVVPQTGQFTLSVARAGAGTGSVSSNPPGINCGADCSEPYNSGTTVTLTASPSGGSTFASWSGCDSVSGATCTVTMNAAKSVTATFNTPLFVLTVNKTGTGSGTVSSSPAGINCGADCSEPYSSGTNVTLTASAAGGSTFGSWSGCDTVSGATCTVTMSAAKTVTATFNGPAFVLTVNKTGSGSGTVSSSPPGISCGADCSEPYASGSSVTLTATAAGGSTFASWSGCNTVSGTTCTVTMSAAKTVTATFNQTAGVTTTGVSAGGEYTCVGRSDGTVKCTGRNQFGQLGDGSWANSSTLLTVSGIATATKVTAGDEYACALLSNGTAKCWGLGESGQRGDGTFGTFALTPVSVNGLTGAVDLATGYGHACARLSDATLRCWGENRDGQLGNGTTANPGTPQPVTVTGITGVTAFTTGAYHTCAVLGNGTLRCWGRGGNAQLGNGTYANSSTPVTVTGISTATSVSGGGAHTCALLNDGTVRCWGENDYGQLGNGTNAASTTPVPVTGLSGVISIAAGWRHTCALLGSGAIQCWGQGESGQLGNGAITNRTTPVAVTGITTAIGINAGWWHHSCAILSGGTVKCWGENQWGQFGNGTTTSSSTPVTMIQQ